MSERRAFSIAVYPRHQGKVLCAFLDGSLRTYTVDELHEADAVVKGLQEIRVTEAQGRLRVEV